MGRRSVRKVVGLVALAMLGGTTFIFGPARADERAQADALNRQMMGLYAQGRYEEAIPLATGVLSILEKGLGPESPEVASALNNLAELNVKLHHYAAAEPLYKRSLTIREKTYGPDHPEVVKSRERLTELYKLEGKDAQPSDGHLKAEHVPLATTSNAPRPAVASAPPTGTTGATSATAAKDMEKARQLNEQSIQLANQGHIAEAIPLTVQVLTLVEKALGPDNPSVASVAGNLAGLYVHQEQFDLAEPLFKRSVAVLEKIHGPDHVDVTPGLIALADFYTRRGRYTEAEPLYRRSFDIRAKVLGLDNPEVTAVLAKLTEFYKSQARAGQAERLYRSSMRNVDRYTDAPPLSGTSVTPDARDLERATTLDRQVSELCDQARYADALVLATELQTLLERMYGPYNIAVAVNLDQLVRVDRGLGKLADAKLLATRSQAIRDAATTANQEEAAPRRTMPAGPAK